MNWEVFFVSKPTSCPCRDCSVCYFSPGKCGPFIQDAVPMLYPCLTHVILVLYRSFHVIIFQKLLISYPYPCQCSCLCLCFLAFLFYIDIRLICIMIMVVQVKGGSVKCLVSSFFVAHSFPITHIRDIRHVCYDIDAHAYLLMYAVL